MNAGNRRVYFFSLPLLLFPLPTVLSLSPTFQFFSTPPTFSHYSSLSPPERILYSAVTYTLSDCMNVLCNRFIPAHPIPTGPPPHHPVHLPTLRHPSTRPRLVPPGPVPTTPSPQPGPTRPQPARHFPTWTHPARPGPPPLAAGVIAVW